jgi:hypothetical protein
MDQTLALLKKGRIFFLASGTIPTYYCECNALKLYESHAITRSQNIYQGLGYDFEVCKAIIKGFLRPLKWPLGRLYIVYIQRMLFTV